MEKTRLKAFRILQGLSREEIAARLKMTAGSYASIENGSRSGNIQKFWVELKHEFNLTNNQVWSLMTNEKED